MNLLQELAKTELTWTMQKSTQPYAPNPKHTVQTILVTVVPEPGAEPLTRHYRADTKLSAEHMVSGLLKEKLPAHPVLREWLDSKGNVPVKLVLSEEDLKYIGSPMHTALRKLADSKQSVITWNSLHHMHPDDRVALWEAAADVVKTAFSGKNLPTRRNLAKALQERVLQVLDERRYVRELTDDEGRLVQRKDSETYALHMMHAGCELTEMDEWMWGWLGYVVEDADEEALEAPLETATA